MDLDQFTQGMEVLKYEVRWQVGSGNNIRFWDASFKFSLTRPPDCKVSLVSDAFSTLKSGWLLDSLKAMLSQEELEAIIFFTISRTNIDDMVV